jgi:hypothetical protein
MTKREAKPTEAELSDKELEDQEGRPLPDREAMSLITPNPEMPVPVDEIQDPLPFPGHHEVPDDRLEE